MTVEDAKQYLSDALEDEDLSDVSDRLFLTWADQMDSFIYRTIRNVNNDQFFIQYPIATVIDQDAYSLPIDFNNISDKGTGLFYTDNNGKITDNPVNYSGLGSQEVGFYINNTELNITPTPKEIKNYILVYMPNKTKITSLTDSLLVDDNYSELVTNFLLKKYFLWAEEPGTASIYDQQFKNNLAEYQKNIRRLKRVVRIKNNNSIY